MKPSNLNYLFNVEYYQVIGLNDRGVGYSEDEKSEHYRNCNLRLTKQDFQNSSTSLPFSDSENSFVLEVSYPGLLVGLGYMHEIGKDNKEQDKDKSLEEAVKLGISLDYVSGLPMIPGSSVKGTLRSAFISLPGYVIELLEQLGIEGIDKSALQSIEREVFGSRNSTGTQRGQDTFFDAIPVGADKQGYLLNLEHITPHFDPNDKLSRAGLKNPRPLRLIKIRPGVKMLFRFHLTDGCISATAKRNLFKAILMQLGAGAKTNVGFGVLKETKASSMINELSPISTA